MQGGAACVPHYVFAGFGGPIQTTRFCPEKPSRATRTANGALVKRVKEAFSRLAVGGAENNSLALAVASVKAELGVDGQQEDAPGGDAAENAGAMVLAARCLGGLGCCCSSVSMLRLPG